MKKITKPAKLSENNPPTPLQSPVVKNSTKMHSRVIKKIKVTKAKSPNLFVFGLIAILAIFVILIVGFLGLQSQGATEANIYKSKTNEYLEKVYNESTIANDNPSETAKNIENIEAPRLGALPLGVFSYSYMGAQNLENNISNQVKGLTDVVKQNGQFYSFYNSYVDTLSEISALVYNGGSAKLSSLENAKAKYKDLQEKVSVATLPTELQASQNNIKEGLKNAGGAIDGMIAGLSSGDRSSYALSSYKYSLASDKLASDFTLMQTYNSQIKERLKLASEHFYKFWKSIE